MGKSKKKKEKKADFVVHSHLSLPLTPRKRSSRSASPNRSHRITQTLRSSLKV